MTLMTEPMPAVPLAPSPRTDTDFDWIDAPDGKLYELIDGQPVEKRVSFYSLWIATQIAALLKAFVEPKDLGFVVTEAPVLGIFGRPNHHRRPDVVYVSRAKLPTLPTEGELTNVVPDLVVEVVSKYDNLADFEIKLQDYLSAGVRSIWVVYPSAKLVRVHHADGTSRILNLTGTLDGETALPGFKCMVGDVFPKT